MKTVLHRIGNSQGVIIPKPLLAQIGLSGEVEMSVEHNAIVLRSPKPRIREGWEEAGKVIAAAGDDQIVWPEFANADDTALKW
jgi:antitoxin MazE